MPYKDKKSHVLLDPKIHDVIKKEHEDTQVPVWKIMSDIIDSSTEFKKLQKKWKKK